MKNRKKLEWCGGMKDYKQLPDDFDSMIVDESAINVSGLLAENDELRRRLKVYEDIIDKIKDLRGEAN